jgi:hypothetical protein
MQLYPGLSTLCEPWMQDFLYLKIQDSLEIIETN